MKWTFWLYAPGAVIFAACMVAYARRFPWRAHRTRWVARAILALQASLFVTFALAALLRLVRLPYSAAIVLAVVALGAVNIAGLAHLAMILWPPRDAPADSLRRDRSTDR